jgi:hypothetical protein
VVWAVFAYRNPFHNAKTTAIRTFAAIGVGWVLIIASTLTITEVDLRLASTPVELERVTSGDGARHVFAVLLGWVCPAIWVGIIWCAVRILRFARTRMTL